MSEAIQILLIVLLVVTIGAVVKLFFVLNNVQQMLETTRKDVDVTLQKANTIIATTDTLLREEITPTIRVARETLAHVEVTTRAISDTTVTLRQLTQRADQLVDSRRLASAGSLIAGAVAKKAAGAAGGLLSHAASGLMGGIRSLFTRGHREQPETLPALPERSEQPGYVAAPKNGIAAAKKRPVSSGKR